MWCGSGAAPAGYSPAPAAAVPVAYGIGPAPEEDCEDCVETRVHYKTIQVPCKKPYYTTEYHQVPKQVSRKVSKQVPYTDYEVRTKKEPYTIMTAETRYKNECQTYQVPVTKTDVIMVPVTRKVPKTIFVDQTFQEKREVKKTVMEPRQRTITVPHTVQVPQTKYRDVNFKVPVQRFRTEYDTQTETVYTSVPRQVCRERQIMVTKRIPVTTVHARPSRPCPPGVPCYRPDNTAQAIVDQHAAMDTNHDGVVDANEALAYAGYTAGKVVPVVGGGYGGYSGGDVAYGGRTSYGGGAAYGARDGASYGGYAVRPSYGSGAAAPAPATGSVTGADAGAKDKKK